MRFTITLGDGVRVSPATYLKALRDAQANPEASFRQSFRDPTGWMGRSYTGTEIVAQHYDMLRERWASWYPAPGKGNRARRRMRQLKAG